MNIVPKTRLDLFPDQTVATYKENNNKTIKNINFFHYSGKEQL